MSDPVEEFREISRRMLESDLAEEEVEELACRWARLKLKMATGAENIEPSPEMVNYLKRRIHELRALAGLSLSRRES